MRVLQYKTLKKSRRASIVKRFRSICVLCFQRHPEVQVHRIRPGAEDGRYTDDNVVLLGLTCHKLIQDKSQMRRILPYLRDLLEDAIRATGGIRHGKMPIKIVREQLSCRTIAATHDHAWKGLLSLYTRLHDRQAENPKFLKTWIEDMCIWPATCSSVLQHLRQARTLEQCSSIVLREYLPAARNLAARNSKGPRDATPVRLLSRARTKRQFERTFREECLRLSDYLIVHERQGMVNGFVHFQYYFKHRYCFLSNVVLPEGKKRPSDYSFRRSAIDTLLINGLLRTTIENHPECRAIIAEVDPARRATLAGLSRYIAPPVSVKKSSLYRLFKAHFAGLKCIGLIRYLQPKSPTGQYRDEYPLLLLYHPMPPHKRTSLSRKELERILDFIYGYVYLDELDNLDDSFNPAQYTAYHQYLVRLKKRVLRGVPEGVPLL